jgi:drug/metabolite transporter (DMT)-like permease
LASGLLSLACHVVLEPRVSLSNQDVILLIVMGIGPLGAAFYLWDAALKRGDARQIGILSYITPLASTALLLIVTGQPLSWSIGLAAALIVGAAVLGTRGQG